MRSQRNAVFKVIQQSALKPSDFYWDEVTSSRAGKEVLQLVHRTSGYYFTFDELRGKHFSMFSPGGEQLEELDYPGSWDLQLRNLATWLEYLAREVSEPDLWQALASYADAMPSLEAPIPSNEPFSKEEASQVRAALNEVREYARKALELVDERFDAVERRLDYLADALDRQGRTDWLHTAVGVFATLALGGIIPPDIAAEFLRHALATLKTAVTSIPGLPWR